MKKILKIKIIIFDKEIIQIVIFKKKKKESWILKNDSIKY
jgi:hypothetical protein